MDKQTEKYLLEIVKRNYEEIAEDFNETRKKYMWPELIELTKLVKNNSKIFDAGCGNGRLIEAFKNKKINYLGVDNSEKLINIAKARLVTANNQPQASNIQFRIGNILELGKIPDVNFDYVFCIAVLHHIPGKNLQISALKQLKNKVNNKGKIIITVWNLWPHKKFRKLIFRVELLKIFNKIKLLFKIFARKKSKELKSIAPSILGDFGDIIFDGFNKKSQRYYYAFTKRGLKRIIKKAGLKIEKIYKDKYNYYVILKK